MQKIDIAEFLTLSEEFPVIDVRSEAEYRHAHFPGAHNIQLFSNEERAEIGLIYHLQGSNNAITKGLDFAGPKFSSYFDQLKTISNKKKVLLYCWRGGMRSSSMAWLFETAGYECFVLTKGYKAFRQHVLASFTKNANIIIIGGKTGSGKTDILTELNKKHEQVLDLEKLACHRGSAFGHLGLSVQPSTEHFENLIFMEWKKFDLKKPVWIEDENQQIGNIFIPSPLWLQMKHSPVIVIDRPTGKRVERLMAEYSSYDAEYLVKCFEKIGRRIGSEYLKTAVDSILNKDYKTACEIALKYYDKAYNNSLSKKSAGLISYLNFSEIDEHSIQSLVTQQQELAHFSKL